MSNLGVGQLAKRAGVAIDTVRYYERSQLLVPAGRQEIKRAAEAKLNDIERRIASSNGSAMGCASLVAACPGHGRAEALPNPERPQPGGTFLNGSNARAGACAALRLPRPHEDGHGGHGAHQYRTHATPSPPAPPRHEVHLPDAFADRPGTVGQLPDPAAWRSSR
jgi:hypothetical protein